MADYDFSKGMYSRKNKDKFSGLSDYESGKHVYFDKKNLFTFGNGDSQKDYKEVDNMHIGQLKLLLSEMQAIVYYLDTTEVKTVVYVGAAPGCHIYVLANLFPRIKFHLYDISDRWDQRLYQEKNITIYNTYFTDEDVEKWQNFKEPFFFISDIRNLTVGDYGSNLSKREDVVWGDMMLQQDWVEKLKPVLSLLKFKLPYPTKEENHKNYLDGTVLRQLFARRSSAETRLLVTGLAYREWDLNNYERMCAYHNQIIRKKAFFFNPLNNNKEAIYEEKGLNNDYESTALTIVVVDYLKKINMSSSETNVKKILDFILDNTYDDRKINLRAERKF